MASTLKSASFNAVCGVTSSFSLNGANLNSEAAIAVGPVNYASGTSVGQADRWYSASPTINPSSSTTLDLNSFTDLDGATVGFVKVDFLVVDNSASNTDIALGNSSTNYWTGIFGDSTSTFKVPAGAVVTFKFKASSAPSVGSSSKLLKVTNLSGGATPAIPKFILVGRSA